MDRFAIGGAAKLFGLQKDDFVFYRVLIGAEADPRHQLMREAFEFGARHVGWQIERHPQETRHNLVQYVGAGIEFGPMPGERPRPPGGLEVQRGDTDIHAGFKVAAAVRPGGKMFASKL